MGPEKEDGAKGESIGEKSPKGPESSPKVSDEHEKAVEKAEKNLEAENGPAQITEGVGPAGKSNEELEEEAAQQKVEEELKETKKVIESKDREMN